MKNKIIQCFGIIAAIFATSCQTLDEPEFGDYPLDPPIITLNTPNAGGSTVIRSSDPSAPVTFNFKVEDDIEIVNITVNVDGIEVANMSDFTDSKNVLINDLVYDASIGTHTLTITAVDSDNNETTISTTFEIEDAPPYSPKFSGEFFYMPYDGDFVELVNFDTAEEIGTPAISDDSVLGIGAYQGVVNSYITVPLDEDELGNEFSAAFWYKLSGEASRAGILVAGANQERQQGFRLFREGSGTSQTIKLNVGTGGGESWNDGGAVAVTGEWVHIAFTISASETFLYVNGVAFPKAIMPNPIDWTGVEEITIGAGGETFSYWDHKSDTNSLIDELRLFNTALSQSDIQNLINASAETLYMPFDGQYKDIAANREVTVVGTPGFAGEGKVGSDAYAGAANSYLTLPSAGLLSEEFSATFWYNVNASPDRAGILVVGPEDTANAGYPEVQNNRTSGFRFFRENADGKQRFKLNVGTGTADAWVDGGANADVANDAGWVHMAFTISSTKAIVYINGVAVGENTITGIDWTGADLVSIMSGAPRFNEWGHLWDSSFMDELRFYNKALTQEEIQAAMAD
ncbi:MAG: LamG domain-containing protein [Gillisia sp.]